MRTEPAAGKERSYADEKCSNQRRICQPHWKRYYQQALIANEYQQEGCYESPCWESETEIFAEVIKKSIG